jgi:hypothetical protein
MIIKGWIEPVWQYSHYQPCDSILVAELSRWSTVICGSQRLRILLSGYSYSCIKHGPPIWKMAQTSQGSKGTDGSDLQHVLRRFSNSWDLCSIFWSSLDKWTIIRNTASGRTKILIYNMFIFTKVNHRWDERYWDGLSIVVNFPERIRCLRLDAAVSWHKEISTNVIWLREVRSLTATKPWDKKKIGWSPVDPPHFTSNLLSFFFSTTGPCIPK